MKKLYTILLLATSLFTTSCSDWLDVAPSNQVNGDKLFEVGDGYRNALNGIYLNLGTSSMYGRAMSWGFMDAIAQYYQTDNNFRQLYTILHNKIRVQPLLLLLWLQIY